ncbi:hypothetical protein SDC9_54651 [bioreactor metagenome]|uniref:DUF5317 domain-containing protein n=1 Tax=bioreactor metagenome TaxID=1076179 RepID=A0A644WX14_9ZZZZ
MIITILAVFLLAKARHYKLRYFFRSWMCVPILLTQGILVFFQCTIFFHTYYFVRYAGLIQQAIILSFLFPIIAYRIYRPAVFGAVSVLTGSVLNNFVMAQNGGKMPVFPSLSYLTGYVPRDGFPVADTVHILGSTATKYRFLTDYIDIGYSVLSPGDLLVHLFTFMMLYCTIKAMNEKHESTPNVFSKM